MNDPDTPLGRGCKNVGTILASIVFLFFAALLIVGWIAITDAQSFSDVPTSVHTSTGVK